MAAVEQAAVEPRRTARPRRLRPLVLDALCVLPAALVLFLWVRSYFPGDLHIRSDSGRLYVFFTDTKATAYVFGPGRAPAGAAQAWLMLEQAPRQTEVWRAGVLGVRLVAHRGGTGFGFFNLAIPYAFLLLPSVLPLWWVDRRRRSRERLAARNCVKCGYDLRHSGDRCPECGTPVPTAA